MMNQQPSQPANTQPPSPASQPTQDTSRSKNNPLADTIREGAIAANIFLGTGKDGSHYHYFALSRSWKNAEGQSGYSGSFYTRNCDALTRVIAAAAERCEELDAKVRHANG